MANFSERVQILKNERNLIQKDLADAAEISIRTYQRYESGERSPDAETIIKLADFFGVSADYLLGRTDKRQ